MHSNDLQSLLPPVARERLAAQGFFLMTACVAPRQCSRLVELLEPSTLVGRSTRASGATFAARGLLWTLPGLRALLRDCGLDSIAATILGRPSFPVDALYFDKPLGANWAVPAHQDRVFPVAPSDSPRARVRHGSYYADLDDSALSELLILRLHFDPATTETGALQLAPGSHQRGIISEDELRATAPNAFITCIAAPGDVLLMRPLAVHRSSPATIPRQRRVLHVVYAYRNPSDELRWRHDQEASS